MSGFNFTFSERKPSFEHSEMEETALKFGPEWIRALTQTNGVAAPVPSTGVTKYKLAKYRYGREEMLAMFDQNVPMPDSLREFQQLAVENTQPPLALVTMTEEEQRVWARSVNSDAVLRLTVGKGAVPGAGPGRGARGGSVDRGRGRGRGSGYQRGIGEEEGQFGAFIRPRPFERSHSLSERDQRWDERDKKPERPFVGRTSYDGDTFRKENAPAGSGGGGSVAGTAASAGRATSDNWRSSSGSHAEEDDNWRSGGGRAASSEKWKSWRNHSKADCDGDDGPPHAVANGPLKKDLGRHWLEEHGGGGSHSSEQLPEWIQDQGDTEKVGCFDAKGAFVDTKDSEEESWENDLLPAPPKLEALPKREEKRSQEPPPPRVSHPSEPSVEKPKSPPAPVPVPSSPQKTESAPPRSPPKPIPPAPTLHTVAPAQMKPVEDDASKVVSTSPKDDSFAHLAKAAENMMAEWTAEEEKKYVSQTVGGEHNLPEHLYRWLYKDPQGDIQGPFSSAEMMEWFQAGYFTMDLMVKRVCDAAFSKLGTLIKSWDVVPFIATQQPPPLKVPHGAELGVPSSMGLGGLPHPGLPNMPPGQMNYALQQQYMQEVYRLAAMQQIQNSLKTNEAFANLSPVDQNRICLQYYMATHSLSRPAGFGDQTPLMNLLSSVGPPPMFGLPPSLMKDPQTDASWPPQPVTTASATPVPESRGTSVWDADSSIVSASLAMPAPPTRNIMETLWQQHQQLASQSLLAEQMRAKEEEDRRTRELQKQARLEEERRLMEERRLLEERRKEEEEQKRRQQEAEALRKEEEERRKREEEELRKRLEEEERQRKVEEQKRKLEEQKRKLEEHKRKIEEQKRKEEQRQLEEEMLRQQRIEEERRRALEVEKRKEEERRAAEEARKAEEKKRQEKARQAAATAAAVQAAAAAQAQSTQPVKKSPSKVSVIDADEFMALRQPPKPQPKVEPAKPEKPQGPVWGGKASQPASSSALSLAEIQRVQEEKERNLAAERLQQQRKQQQAMQQAMLLQQQQQQHKATLTWASRAQASSSGAVKSLSEIQQEEAERADKMKKAQQQQRQQQQIMRQQESSILQLGGAWGSSTNNLLKSFNNSFQYLDLVPDEDSSRGFWDEAATAAPPAAKPAPKQAAKPASSFPSLGGGASSSSSTGRSSKGQQSKRAEEQVMKLFEEHAKAAPTDELTAWCVQRLSGIQSYLDIPTVVAILKDVESPAEVQEYVHNFFGSSQDTTDFVRQFLQKREQYQKAGSALKTDEAFTVPIVSSASSATGAAAATVANDGFMAARSKKKKKKMQKVDSSLLGFTVQADPTRLNAGEIDRVEGL